MTALVSRTQELSFLKRLMSSGEPEFLAVYGRRRIGKTYLIRHFFNDVNAICLEVTGLK